MDILSTVGLFASVFGVSMAVSYVVTSWRGRHQEVVDIPENTKVRIVGPGGAYRCYFVRAEKSGLIFTSPLHRDIFVPIREGETLIVQAPLGDGLLTFTSSVIHRDPESHNITLKHPVAMRRVDRRAEVRSSAREGSWAKINGEPATLVDLSAGGVRLCTKRDFPAGDMVRVELPDGLGESFGWALESLPGVFDGRQGSEVRVQFQRPLSGLRAGPGRRAYTGR